MNNINNSVFSIEFELNDQKYIGSVSKQKKNNGTLYYDVAFHPEKTTALQNTYKLEPRKETILIQHIIRWVCHTENANAALVDAIGGAIVRKDKSLINSSFAK